jgi:hypothetical protein
VTPHRAPSRGGDGVNHGNDTARMARADLILRWRAKARDRKKPDP